MSKWHMNRLGLVDFWYYDYQEFHFKDGHMMLRGGNGSGKSVTMQSFLPLILDGNKSSSRLDPFGSRDRKIEDYLIDEVGQRDERIGYLFLEFKREDIEKYITIGLGMQAKKNTKMNTWYFVIKDNQRIGKDIHLFQNQLAITKQSLKNLINDQLIETQGEYSRSVNEALFGFDSEQEYKEMLDLMIQLRSPKLSNSLKPVKLNEILNNSLQPLSDDDLRPMTEAITSMDATKDQVFMLEENIKASKAILDVYHQYNYRILYDKAKRYLDIQAETQDIANNIQKSINDSKDAESQKARLKAANVNIDQKIKMLENEKANLLQEDLKSLVLQLDHDRLELKDANAIHITKEKQLDDKLTTRTHSEHVKRKQRSQVELIKEDIDTAFSSLETLQEQLQFEEHIALKSEFLGNLNEPYNVSFTKKRIDDEILSINLGLERFEKIIRHENEHKIYLESLEKEKAAKESLLHEKETEETRIKNTIEQTVVSIYQWNNSNKYMKIDIPTLESLVLDIEASEVEDSSTVIKNKVHSIYSFLETGFIKEEAKYEPLIAQLKEKKIILETQVLELKSKKKVSLPLDESTIENRKLLKEFNIEHSTLYELLDFEDTLEDVHKNQIEEKLKRANLLGAQLINSEDFNLITSENHKTSEQYLVTEHKISNLTQFVLTENFVKQEDWSGLFEHFGITSAGLRNVSDRVFYSNLYTVITTNEPAKYIGEKTRENFRKQEIQRVESEILELKNEIVSMINQRQTVVEKRNILETEYNKMPKLSEIHILRDNIKFLEIQVLEKISSIEIHNKHLDNIRMKTREDILYVSEIANKLGINSHEQSFKKLKEYLTCYKESLLEMMTSHKIYLKDIELLNKINSDLLLLEDDISILRDEISSSERRMDRLNTSITQIESQLEARGYEKIKERITEINQSLIDNQETKTSNVGLIGEMRNKISNLKDKIKELEGTFNTKVSYRERATTNYEEELSLGYVSTHNDAREIMKHIREVYPTLKGTKELSANLQEEFILKTANLQEYKLRRANIFTDDEDAIRFDISARFAGENINIIMLHEYLIDANQRQKLLLEEKDRELIEEILINTISKKIRNRIQQSKSWVVRINRYMDNMKTSSGLKLSLNWQSRRGDTDDELNSEKLITLLERDVRLLKDNDKEALLKHFTSKITLARKKADLEETEKSFHQIMSEIMDFRTWFDFKIMVQKQGERKKELTNNIFNTYSGGEKAMSMYIPLFSALAAKYESGKEDAPNIIALDEAFAGVDENNIDNMFELIRRFKFDYIMNSQVLWGDYPSVRGLSIYELFRPENAPYVTIIHYEWNGTTKRMVT